MKKTLKCLVATALLAFIFLPVLEAQDDRCPEADSRTAAELADTIRSGKLRAVCMDRSIRRLGTLHAVDAIPLLINLLDYKRDPDYSETLGYSSRLGDWYPSVVALFEIGKPALPNLLKFLAGGEPKSVAFHKGVEAYMTITREDRVSAVRDIVAAAASAGDEFARANLMEASHQAIDFCRRPGQKALCEASLAPKLTP